MESNKINNSLKRHFNFPSCQLDSVSQKPNWRWINDGSCLTNANRDIFPLLTSEKDDEFKDIKESMKNYEDVIYANRNYKKADETRKAYCEHIMDHLQKCSKVMRKNNDRVSERGDKISDIRDQGFHRCRVMIILPTRNSALEVVKCLRGFMPKHKVTKKWKKFLENFNENAQNDSDEEGSEVEADDEEADAETSKAKELMETINENIKLSNCKQAVKKSGIDFDEWITGNINERFLFGVSVEKKQFSVYTDLKLSDIVIGSPTSIRELVDDRKNYMEQLVATSSTEIVVIDQLEYMVVQNFDNIFPCFDKLNQTPHGGGECIKLMNSTLRVHEWALSHCGANYRQNIVLSSVLHPFMKKIMSACKNFQGTSIFLPRPRYRPAELVYLADMLQKQSQQPPAKRQKQQLHDKITFLEMPFSLVVPDDCKGADVMSTDMIDMSPPDGRMSLFRRKVLPLLTHKLSTGGVLIYCSQTIDVYSIHQLIKSENLSVACVTEDQDERQSGHVITLFAKCAIKFLVISERFYALTRRRFQALRHIVYYSTPTFPHFARDFHEFMLYKSRATTEAPHTVISLVEEELFEQINSQLAFKVLYGQ